MLSRPAAVVALCLMALVLVTAAGAAAQPGAGSESAEIIRATADEVLSRPAYTGLAENPISRFLRSNPVSQWIAERVNDFLEWLAGLGSDNRTAPTAEADPDRGSGLGVILMLTVALTIIVVLLLLRSLDRRQPELEDTHGLVELDEATLSDLADRAERLGDYELAVRYRFQAGLRRLDRSGLIESDETTATGAVRRQVAMAEFDDVATAFEKATYSEYQATPDDAHHARRGWEAVLARLARSRDGDS